MQEALAALTQVNETLGSFNPLVATLFALGKALVDSIKSSGNDIGPFQAEIDKFDALVAKGFAVDAAWRAEHGLPAVGSNGNGDQ